ncbi:MAG TPA: hypothetical protein VEJ67_14375 [Candidatus Cybelea sp.]|nr:hypothetical protein [Candidatus Cybelea sp.]
MRAILVAMRLTLPLLFLATLSGALSARADELKLKDGTKIVGTIVGFEENSFKVKTSYGFAVVQKDQVASISMSDSAKKSETEKKPDVAATKPAAEGSADRDGAPKSGQIEGGVNPGSAKGSAAGPNTHLAAPTSVNAPAAAAQSRLSAPSAANAQPAPGAAGPEAPGAPPDSPVPQNIREEVAGNTYTNDTYGFSLYKPPGWQLIDDARQMLPGTITALGTGDQTTYLLIGQAAAGKSLTSDLEATERRLRDVMDNFRPLGDKRITVSGSEGIERRFRGSVDQHDWSGTVALIPHGTRVYTIFGMTAADSDLVQIQENVISRTISSLQFTK